MKKKILVVDDEMDFLAVVRIRLEANDFEVIIAHSGEEALDKIWSIKPDAVLLDIMMPGLSGIDVLAKIREVDKLIPVFIITAYSNEERFRSANQLNVSGFIIKSGNLSEELKKISSILG